MCNWDLGQSSQVLFSGHITFACLFVALGIEHSLGVRQVLYIKPHP